MATDGGEGRAHRDPRPPGESREPPEVGAAAEQAAQTRSARFASSVADVGAAGRLSTVLHETALAVVMLSLEDGQVLYANGIAQALAPALTLPVSVREWQRAVGVGDPSGVAYDDRTSPIDRVAQGAPVLGEQITLSGSDATRRMWLTGVPLDAPGLQDRALVVLLELSRTGSAHDGDPDPLRVLRERVLVTGDLSFTISDPRQPDNPLVWVNDAFTRTTGYAPDAVLGRNCRFLQGPDTDRAAVAEIHTALDESRPYGTTLLNYRADGTAFWNQLSVSPVFDVEGGLTHFVGVQSDVTQIVALEEERRALLSAQAARVAAESARSAAEEAEAAQTYQAMHDSLTGLPNRALVLDRLEHATLLAARNRQLLAVLFVDLDDFKVVNDSLGHGAGDELLVEVSRRLSATLRDADTAGRLGGDEFVVICEDLTDARQAQAVADRFAEELARPVTVAGEEIVVSASIGIAVAAGEQAADHQLLVQADQAMYRAKRLGKGGSSVWDSSLGEAARRRLHVEQGLRRALAHDEFRLRYQPVIDLESRRLVGVEALLRWQPPEGDLLAPQAFLEVAESTDLMLPIGDWVLRQAFAQARAWQDLVPEPVTVAVNLSARQLGQGRLAPVVQRLLAETAVRPGDIVLELTESQLLGAGGGGAGELADVRSLGVRVAIDDFGVGYGSLAYLRELTVDVLKVDRSFVAGLGVNRADDAIVAAVVGLARSLDLTVVAEGVETERQAQLLGDLGCEQAQGFRFRAAEPPGDVQDLIGRAVPGW